MKIIRVENGSRSKAYLITARLGVSEFEQLAGSVRNLVAFSAKKVDHATSYTKTGARGQTKYVLLPSALRRQIDHSKYDFNRLTCGLAGYRNDLFLIFKVPGLIPWVEE